MVAYAGARPQPALLPRRLRRAKAVPRRRPKVHARAHRRSSPVSLSLAAIVVSFLLGLVYLSQTLHVAATNYDIDALSAERERLEQELRIVQGEIARHGAEPAILKGAQGQGLSGLGRPLRLTPP
jgi:hypothetical protein